MTDTNRHFVNLTPKNEGGKEEQYSMEAPQVIVGNLIIGESYTEPQGITIVQNHTTGEKCSLEFKARGWTSKHNNSCSGVVKDANGKPVYEISGKYTESLVVKNLNTGETFTAWTAPTLPENNMMMYGFNSFTLQLNLINNILKEKLPPTDSRFRPDVQLWEEGKQEEASDEKNRLENNQRARKK